MRTSIIIMRQQLMVIVLNTIKFVYIVEVRCIERSLMNIMIIFTKYRLVNLQGIVQFQ